MFKDHYYTVGVCFDDDSTRTFPAILIGRRLAAARWGQ